MPEIQLVNIWVDGGFEQEETDSWTCSCWIYVISKTTSIFFYTYKKNAGLTNKTK